MQNTKLRLKRIQELGGVFVSLVKDEGLPATVKRAAGFCKRRFGTKKGRFLPPSEILDAQRKANTGGWPVFSICVPLYNTPPLFLRQMLDSVMSQTCRNWQLCLADASDTDAGDADASDTDAGDADASDTDAGVYTEVEAIVREYQQRPQAQGRILYTRVANLGIAQNTNAAARLATGEYLALCDHDDALAPHAVFELATRVQETGASFLYSDEALFVKDIRRATVAHFKPDFAPDYLNCCNYICHLAAFRRDLFWQIGGLDPACDGSQDHDLFLKLSEIAPPEHIARVLYYWRVHAASTSANAAAKPYAAASAKRAVAAHLERIGARATVADGLFPSTYKVEYEIVGEPLVSILIPNMDHREELDKALQSIFLKTLYTRYEIIILENNSTRQETFDYYKSLCAAHANCSVVEYPGGGFNFSAINNFGRQRARGSYLLLLNNDVEVINGAWLSEMLALCSQPGVGIVGAKLYYSDDTLQHAGVITGLGGFAGHSHKYARRGGSGYMFRAATVQNFSAVTAACMLVKASVYDEFGGLDETFTVAFNDVDFCLRVRNAGYRVLFTPYAELYHYESKSRGLDTKGASKLRFDGERARMKKLYGKTLTQDPFYNQNLTLDREDFSESDALPQYRRQM